MSPAVVSATPGRASIPIGRGSVTRAPNVKQKRFCITPREQRASALFAVTVQPEHDKYGFNLSHHEHASCRPGATISRVEANSAADRAGLERGDRLVAINGIAVSSFSHDDIVAMIKTVREHGAGSLRILLKSQRPLSTSMRRLESRLKNGKLVTQFEVLPVRGKALCTAARQPVNNWKNRYSDIAPYDSTRVVLKDPSQGDYVNASHVRLEAAGSGVVNRFICAQAPLATTEGHFWCMIWEQSCTLVVMLANAESTQCHRYWPHPQETRQIHDFQMTCIRESRGPAWTQRELNVSRGDESRQVTQLQYTAWPDHGVPASSRHFIAFLLLVRKLKSVTVESTLVHCSAGIGRTGVLLLVDAACTLIEASQEVEPLSLLTCMREQRGGLVQTPAQFAFACHTILSIYKDEIIRPQNYSR